MKINFKTILSVFALSLSIIFLLNGCNTVQGVGKDLKQGGQAIESAASGKKSNSPSKTTTVKTTTTTPISTQTTTQTTTTTPPQGQ